MDPIYLLYPAALMVGTAKGGLSSIGSLAVPLVALVMNPVTAAALLLPVYIVTDWVSVALYRRHYSAPNLKIMIPGMLAGVALATLMVSIAPEALLLILTGVIGLWYCLRSWGRALLKRPQPDATRPALIPGLGWSLLAGVAIYITHSAGPPTQAYLLPQRLPKLEFAGTIALCFAVVNLSKLPGYWLAGQFDALDWALLPGLVATGVAGTALGRWLTGVLPQAAYVRVIEALLLLLSVILLTKGITGLIQP